MVACDWFINSCGHTTDFYPGKKVLSRANSSKISPEINSSRVLFYQGKNSGKVTLSKFSCQLNFLEHKFKKAKCAGI